MSIPLLARVRANKPGDESRNRVLEAMAGEKILALVMLMVVIRRTTKNNSETGAPKIQRQSDQNLSPPIK